MGVEHEAGVKVFDGCEKREWPEGRDDEFNVRRSSSSHPLS